jgi:cysteine-rich repeat protein
MNPTNLRIRNHAHLLISLTFLLILALMASTHAATCTISSKGSTWISSDISCRYTPPSRSVVSSGAVSGKPSLFSASSSDCVDFTYIRMPISTPSISKTADYRPIDHSCKYECPDGYGLVGFRSEYIYADGSDCDSYRCIEIGGGGRRISKTAEYRAGSNAYENTCTYTCPEGYALQGFVAEWVQSRSDCNTYHCQEVTNCLDTYYLDADSDDFYPPGGKRDASSSPGSGWTTSTKSPGDCDDSDLNMHPNTIWYIDDDSDNYYPVGGSKQQCSSPGVAWTYTEKLPTDCNDANPLLTTNCGDCGNNVVESGEDCDVGLDNGGPLCPIDCDYVSTCGNSNIETWEECDDGDLDGTDWCTPKCNFNICGDGFAWLGIEQCDDGNNNASDGCGAYCIAEVDCSTYSDWVTANASHGSCDPTILSTSMNNTCVRDNDTDGLYDMQCNQSSGFAFYMPPLCGSIELGQNRYVWETTPWSECSATPSWGAWGGCQGCDTGIQYKDCENTEGTQIRTVMCKDTLTGQPALKESLCPGTKPPEQQVCTEDCTGPAPSQSCDTGVPCCTNHKCSPSGARTCFGCNYYGICDDYDGDGCLEWGGFTSCGSGLVCSSNGECVLSSCTDECSAGARTCSASHQYEVCYDRDGDCCLEWSDPINCCPNNIRDQLPANVRPYFCDAKPSACSGGSCRCCVIVAYECRSYPNYYTISHCPN